tara:strand:- start:2996 stop:3448 length:453 start_codon:yes stop_codon:yes gene_type:complete
MRMIVQRVSEASVFIENKKHSSIGQGLLVYVGWGYADATIDSDWMIRKILNMRIFNDHEDVMNRSIIEVQGQILVVSQFTLFASTKKGNRPSYMRSANNETAKPLYNDFLEKLWTISNLPIKSGIFGADMEIKSINEGPITIYIDSKNKE